MYILWSSKLDGSITTSDEHWWFCGSIDLGTPISSHSHMLGKRPKPTPHAITTVCFWCEPSCPASSTSLRCKRCILEWKTVVFRHRFESISPWNTEVSHMFEFLLVKGLNLNFWSLNQLTPPFLAVELAREQLPLTATSPARRGLGSEGSCLDHLRGDHEDPQPSTGCKSG